MRTSLLFLFATSFAVASPSLALADDAASASSSTPDAPPPRTTELHLGLGGGDAPGLSRAYSTTALIVLLPLGARPSLEIAGAGALTASKDDGGWYWLRLALGLRVDLTTTRFRPYASARAMHIHMAPTSVWKSHLGDSLAGSSDEGLGHRSGLAGAAGFTWSTSERGPWRLGAEIEEAWIPIGHGPRSLTTILGTVGYAL